VNGTDIVRQWLDVHGLGDGKPQRGSAGPADHLEWRDASGRVAVESFTLPALAHGVPISAHDPDAAQRCGAAAPYVVESGVSSSYLIAAFWGLVPPAARREAGAASPRQPARHGVASMIQKALKAAGLPV
jgi:poly(3-hydroxybutyrate) depolymerase